MAHIRLKKNGTRIPTRVLNVLIKPNGQPPQNGKESKIPNEDPDLREKIVVVIPAFNEQRFIGSTVMMVLKYAAIVIVVDDGSKDATAELAEASGAFVVRHTMNQGKGAALNTGFRAALGYNPQVVVTMDADGQHRPEEIIQVAKPVLDDQADIAVGSRYLNHPSCIPRSRIWGHLFFNSLMRITSGIAATDSQSGFRSFSPKALEKIIFQSQGFSVESEMQFIAKDLGLRMKDVSISGCYMDKPKRPLIKHGLIVLYGILRLMSQYRPLLLFGGPGFFLLTSGLLWEFIVLDIYSHTKALNISSAMLSALLIIIGILCLSTGMFLYTVRGQLLEFMHRMDHVL